jgi:hypothetical protein
MLLFYDGVTVPSGWTCVSCANGDPFYQTFPRGNDIYGATGGTVSHTHNAIASVAAGSGTASQAQTGTLISGTSHTHSATLTIGSASNLPQFRQLKIIRSDVQGEPAIIPAGTIGLFDATPPAGWTAYSNQDTYYPYGENTAGTTGGSNTHSHSLSGSLAAANGGLQGTANGNTVPSAPAEHTHNYSGSSGNVNNEPPYIGVIFAKIATDSTPPDNLLAMWDDDIPTNWTSQSNSGGDFYQRFIKGASSYGTTGGGDSHTHTQANITSGAPNEAAVNSKSGTATSSATHTHIITISNFSDESQLPPYRDVIIAKRVPQVSIEQSGYRFYENSNSTDVGSPLAANNTPASSPPKGNAFRLRMLLHVNDANLGPGNKQLKLQYAERSGTCDTSFTGEMFQDISPSSGDIRYYNNSTPTDGSALTGNANDPTHSGHSVINQSYEEENNFTTISSVAIGEDGMWDFALVDSSADPETSYCVRAVYADGSLLETYSVIPEFLTDNGAGHMLLLYDGASAPTGWTCVSCGSESPFYERFIRGGASYGAIGGTSTHGHTASINVNTTTTNTIQANTGSGVSAEAHNHAVTGSVTDASNLPPYRNLLVIRANNSGVPSTLPTGAIALFDGTLPSGWTGYSAQNGQYIRGGATAGGTGGSLTHTHPLTANLAVATGETTAATNGGTAPAALAGHTHTASGASVAANHEPPYREVILAKLDSAAAAPQNIITYWDNPPPSSWTNLSAVSGDPFFETFAKPAASYGASGGSANHLHTDSTIVSDPTSAAFVANRRTGTGSATGAHTHNVVFSSFSTANSLPPYREAIVAKQGALNNPPSSPSGLDQLRTSDSISITVGGYTNGGQVRFEATASDPDSLDDLQLCVEVQPIGSPFTNTITQCGAAETYTGSPVDVSVTITGLVHATSYHWQAQVKDGGGATSAWVSFGANLESDTDFTNDSVSPSGTVYDGTGVGVDINFNGGSLSEISANWAITDVGSGLNYFEYAIGTTPGSNDVIGWVNAGLATNFTESSLTLETSKTYYASVRAYDNANNSSTTSSDGQMVTPSITFAINPLSIDFDNLNASNSFTDTKDITLTTSTNARAGYDIRSYTTTNLTSNISNVVGQFSSGTYNLPAEWGISDFGYGYTSSDTFVNGLNRFQSATCPGGGSPPCFAPFALSAPGDIVADNNDITIGTPINNESFTITHRVSTQNSQPAGKYQTVIIYSAAARY